MVASFGTLVDGGTYIVYFGYDDVIALANRARWADQFGYGAEFVNLMRLVKSAVDREPQRR